MAEDIDFSQVQVKEEPADPESTDQDLATNPAAYIDSLLKSNYDITQIKPAEDPEPAAPAEEYGRDDSQDSDVIGVIEPGFLMHSIPPLDRELLQDEYGQWVCKMCSKTFTNKTDLKRHHLSHTDERPFGCRLCGKRFKFKSHVKEHELTHTDEKNHPCTKCGRAFRRVSDANRHMRACMSSSPYKTSEPAKLKVLKPMTPAQLSVPSSTGMVTYKLVTVKAPPPPPLVRMVAPRASTTVTLTSKPASLKPVNNGIQAGRPMMRSLLTRPPLAPKPSPVVIIPQPQPVVAEKSSSSQSQDTSSIDVSSIEIKKEILSDEEAVDDIDPEVAAWKRERPHQCHMCQRRFKLSKHLTSHMATHTGEKIHPCPKCGKKFVLKSYVSKHEYYCEGPREDGVIDEMDAEEATGHDSDPDEEGNEPLLKISSVTSIADGMALYEGNSSSPDDLPRCHPCRFCGKMFKRSHHAREHERIHTNSQKRNFSCPKCGRAFMRRLHMTNHLKSCTGELPPGAPTSPKSPDDVSMTSSPLAEIPPDPDDPDYDPDRPYPCSQCDKRFKLKHHLRDHLLVHASAQRKTHGCPKCGKRFARPSYVAKHMSVCQGFHGSPTIGSLDNSGDDDIDVKPDVDELNRQILALNEAAAAGTSGDVPMETDDVEGDVDRRDDGKDLAPVSRILSRLHVPGTTHKAYQCDVCPKRFHLPHQLRDHKSSSHGRALFQCSKCRRFLLSKSAVEKHMQICKADVLDHGERPHQCYICEKRFKTKLLLKEHHSTHVSSPEQSLQCARCEEVFSEAAELVAHHKTCTIKEKVQPGERVVVATYTYPSAEEIVTLQQQGLPITGKVEINRNALLPPYLRQKTEKTDSENGDLDNSLDMSDNSLLESSLLSEPSPAKKQKMAAPVVDENIGSRERPELGICDSCGEVLVSVKALNKHYEEGTVCKPSRSVHRCTICKNHLPTSYGLTVHQSLHVGHRYFNCEVCQKLFSTKFSLLYHLNAKHMQTGDMPEWYLEAKDKETNNPDKSLRWECTDCDKKFISWFALSKHHLSHTGVVLEVCDLCGKSYILLSHLEEHQRLHMGETPYRCKVCGFASSHLKELNKHRFQHTGYDAQSGNHTWRCQFCNLCFRSTELPAHEKTCSKRPVNITPSNALSYVDTENLSPEEESDGDLEILDQEDVEMEDRVVVNLEDDELLNINMDEDEVEEGEVEDGSDAMEAAEEEEEGDQETGDAAADDQADEDVDENSQASEEEKEEEKEESGDGEEEKEKEEEEEQEQTQTEEINETEENNENEVDLEEAEKAKNDDMNDDVNDNDQKELDVSENVEKETPETKSPKAKPEVVSSISTRPRRKSVRVKFVTRTRRSGDDVTTANDDA